MLNLNGMLSIVMPAYNEEKLIYHSIMETLRIVEKFVPELEIIAVNDGSKDNTKAEIERAIKQDSRVRMVSSEKNRGKGNAIIAGVSQVEGKYVAFVDADLELNPSQLEGYLKKMLDDMKLLGYEHISLSVSKDNYAADWYRTVSYTHLTLPTIRLV